MGETHEEAIQQSINTYGKYAYDKIFSIISS